MLRNGIDIVEIVRLERALERWPRLNERLFTPGELAYSNRRARPAEHLAARFAAKEAAFKALGSGWPQFSWHDVEVTAGEDGPMLILTGRAGLKSSGLSSSVSLSHDGGLAIAQVLFYQN